LKRNLKRSEIKEIREALGFTQKKLADILGVSNAAISGWEDGTLKCKAIGMLKLSLLKLLEDYKPDARHDYLSMISGQEARTHEDIKEVITNWLKNNNYDISDCSDKLGWGRGGLGIRLKSAKNLKALDIMQMRHVFGGDFPVRVFIKQARNKRKARWSMQDQPLLPRKITVIEKTTGKAEVYFKDNLKQTYAFCEKLEVENPLKYKFRVNTIELHTPDFEVFKEEKRHQQKNPEAARKVEEDKTKAQSKVNSLIKKLSGEEPIDDDMDFNATPKTEDS